MFYRHYNEKCFKYINITSNYFAKMNDYYAFPLYITIIKQYDETSICSNTSI